MSQKISKSISKLTVPNDTSYIKGALSYSKEISERVGFSEKEVDEIADALKEACENVITHAFDPYEDESFTITFEILQGGLKIYIDEMGLPYSNTLVKKNQETPGLNVIEANMDSVTYINRGKEGKELELIKYLKGRHVEEIFTRDELKPYVSCEILPADHKYTIRPMLPEEAVDVSRCIYRTYRYSYLNEDLYFPERIETMNKEGRMYSYVAVTEAGDIVGHFALMSRPNRLVAQIGVAVVVPKHRGQGLMKRLLERLMTAAVDYGFTALYGDALALHTMSQRTNLQYGFSETAIQLANFPPCSVTLLHEKKYKGAGTVITFFKYIRESRLSDVFLPARHTDILKDIYKRLGVSRNFKEGPKVSGVASGVAPKESEIDVRMNKYQKVGTIYVKSYGEDVKERVMAKLNDLEAKGFISQYLDLRLDDPFTPEASAIFEENGFIFSGLLPDYSDGDILRLQHYNYTTELYYDEVETESPFATELLEYIKKLDPKQRIKSE